MIKYFNKDLAYIHDVGFSDFAAQASRLILNIIPNSTPLSILDLGCGTGVLAEILYLSGHKVVGIDISPEMIELARKRVPECKFIVSSFFTIDFPRSHVIVSTGECLNYLFDPHNDEDDLRSLFSKVYEALPGKGYFIFDLLEPGQITTNMRERYFSRGNGWYVLIEKHEDQRNHILTRHIITFRKTEDLYRKSEEIHKARLYPNQLIQDILRDIGFRVQLRRHYDNFELKKNHALYICRK